MAKRRTNFARRTNRRRIGRNPIKTGSTACMPYQQYVRGTASLSVGNNFVTYTIANLFSDLTGRTIYPHTFVVKFEPIFPTGSTPGTNIIFAQLQFRDPSTITDVPASTVKLLSQTNQTRFVARIPYQSSGWFVTSNTSIILSLYINTSIACNLNYEIDSRAWLARDTNT
jgi:hypothetical protein